ncbi:putative HTLV-1-related endogenous sequence [Pan troglodytes]|uniref:putative HTLV-1-related endogenous sequence n=1 Tax=Pan troglodytes TaxID=9598 RepID=UPI0030139CEF
MSYYNTNESAGDSAAPAGPRPPPAPSRWRRSRRSFLGARISPQERAQIRRPRCAALSGRAVPAPLKGHRFTTRRVDRDREGRPTAALPPQHSRPRTRRLFLLLSPGDRVSRTAAAPGRVLKRPWLRLPGRRPGATSADPPAVPARAPGWAGAGRPLAAVLGNL